MPSQPLLLESIRLIDGRMPYLNYHQERLERSRAIYYRKMPAIDLASEIDIPKEHQRGLYKVRVTYGESVLQLEIQPYTIRPVKSLELVQVKDLDYAHKYADRQALQTLFEQRTYGDDILMVRDGLLTDTSYANVALYDGDRWFTPAQPVLLGTARTRYLDDKRLHPADIKVADLKRFQKLKLINAMMEWKEGPEVEIRNIRF